MWCHHYVTSKSWRYIVWRHHNVTSSSWFFFIVWRHHHVTSKSWRYKVWRHPNVTSSSWIIIVWKPISNSRFWKKNHPFCMWHLEWCSVVFIWFWRYQNDCCWFTCKMSVLLTIYNVKNSEHERFACLSVE